MLRSLSPTHGKLAIGHSNSFSSVSALGTSAHSIPSPTGGAGLNLGSASLLASISPTGKLSNILDQGFAELKRHLVCEIERHVLKPPHRGQIGVIPQSSAEELLHHTYSVPHLGHTSSAEFRSNSRQMLSSSEVRSEFSSTEVQFSSASEHVLRNKAASGSGDLCKTASVSGDLSPSNRKQSQLSLPSIFLRNTQSNLSLPSPSLPSRSPSSEVTTAKDRPPIKDSKWNSRLDSLDDLGSGSGAYTPHQTPPVDATPAIQVSRPSHVQSPQTPHGQSPQTPHVLTTPREGSTESSSNAPICTGRLATSPRLHVPGEAVRIFADQHHVVPSLDDTIQYQQQTTQESGNSYLHFGTTISQPITFQTSDESLAATIQSAEQTPVDRWYRLCSLMIRPKTRARLTNVYRAFHMHDIWAVYLRMLVHNEGNCQQGFVAATKKIAAFRKGGKRTPEGTSRYSPRSTTFGMDNYLIHPDSGLRRAWSLLALIVISHDTFLLPFYAFFDYEPLQFLKTTSWIASIFWVLDIAVILMSGKYIAGVLVLDFWQLTRRHMTSRMPFDILLVVLDWTLILIYETTNSRPLGSYGVSLRSIRVVRMFRLFRLGRWQILLQEALSISNKTMIAFSGVTKASFAYLIYCHFLACWWYGVGQADEHAWGYDCKTGSVPVEKCYARALHWAITQTHGTTDMNYNTTPEWIFASLSVLFGFFLFACLLGMIVDATAQMAGAEKLELRQRCSKYASRHKLTSNLVLRLTRFIEANDIEMHLDRVLQEERDLLSILPVSMQAEVLEETRRPLLSICIILDLRCISSKMITQLCSEAITSQIIGASEIVFSVGDQGSFWRVVDIGNLLYLKGNDDMWGNFVSIFKAFQDEEIRDSVAYFKKKGNGASSYGIMSKSMSAVALPLQKRSSVRRSSVGVQAASSLGSTLSQQGVYSAKVSPFAKVLSQGASIAEMVLWTQWEHTGDLIAAGDCMLLQLNLEAFYLMVQARLDTCLLASRYAQQYVKQLSCVNGGISDLFQYDETEDDEELLQFHGGDSTSTVVQHLIFLSHYKAEAGTEAALMQEGLQGMIAHSELEFTSVFLDSEDLVDISRVQEHVVNSKNLLLLLTPGVLTRPWCLVEIVTANINDVQVVPVEIQRPGLNFVYPDDDFYAKLRSGELLSSQDIKLLTVEGISVEDVEDALRNVFTQIALPFSPHKSRNVREAELSDIMRRCTPKEFLLTGSQSRSTHHGSVHQNSVHVHSHHTAPLRQLSKTPSHTQVF